MGYDDFEGGGGTLFPYYDLGGCGKFPTKITSSIGERQPFFPENALKDDLLDDTAWPVVMQWFNEDH